MKALGVLLAAVAFGSASAIAWSAAQIIPRDNSTVEEHRAGAVHASSGVPVPQAGESFVCTPTRVWDGDGPIWCAEGERIRLAGIAAREVRRVGGGMADAGCKTRHPCSTMDGVRARDHLVSLIGRATGRASTGHVLVSGEPLTCQSEGSGKGVRTAAWCRNDQSGDLSRAMVRDGYAVRWERYWRD